MGKTKKSESNATCCVIGCINNKFMSDNELFYRFPFTEQRREWIAAVRKINGVDINGKPWGPNYSTLICCHHFVGKQKSVNPLKNSYVPTIFQSVEETKEAKRNSGREEDILIGCILRHASIIENKRTDACTLRAKKRAWQEIGVEFNALCPNEARPVQALRDKYTNLKTLLRKQLLIEKPRHNSTGIGSEWRPKSKVMAQLATFLSTSRHEASSSPPIDDDADGYYDYNESHDTILPSVESFKNESDDAENPLDSVNLQTVEILPNDDGDDDDDDNDDDKETIFPLKISQTSSIKSLPKYNIPRIGKQKRLTSAASSSSSSSSHYCMGNALQILKKKMIERTLEMREIEHQTRLEQQQREHEARMALLDAQRMDFETKVELRQLRITKLVNKSNIKTETEYE